MRVAVIGSGISGLGSAYVLANHGVEEVVLYEKEESLGGHDAKTIHFDGVDLDLGFMVFNHVTYPNMMEFFENLGVDMEVSDMSFSVSLDNGKGYEWGSRNGLSGLFAQKKNAFNPYFWQMIREIVKFKEEVLKYIEALKCNPDIDQSETLGEFLNARGYSELFQQAYLVPICGSIWSCPSDEVLNLSAYSVFSFCCNHHLLQIFGRPQWLTVAGRSQTYVAKVRAELERLGCKIRTSCHVKSVSTSEDGSVTVTSGDGSQVFDRCILAMDAPDALRLLGEEVTFDESRVLGAFRYVYSDVYLHHDIELMPRNQAAWSAWNFLGSTKKKVCVTYWLNVIQNLGETREPFFVTLNPDQTPKKTLLKWTTGHPVPSVAASKASQELHKIQGKRNIWFCGTYQGYGFHEDGLKVGMAAARGLLGKEPTLLNNPQHMILSLTETASRLFVTRFFGQFISTGCVTILEEGGTVYTFGEKTSTCPLKSVLKIRSPQFYWKVMTQLDLGLADAYINGDFSFVDKDYGLLNLIMIFIANRDRSSTKKRGWWTPMSLTAGLASAKYVLKYISRKNTLTQARRNISHYDLSNELFGFFLDDTMSYSCAIFKSDDEDLRTAQMRKISLLIDKMRIEKNHEVLEIGFGWGTLAIEVVRRTGCKYTGITLSIEQLKYAEEKVKEAGLQDRITFKLCDYRQLSDADKYDRIISCEMLEAVGHEFMEMFFSCCEASLAQDGIVVLQFTSIPEERYDENRLSPGFISEYIFPGCVLLSLARITSAMASSSRLCIEHVENIGNHYYKTLRCWKQNFLERRKEIMDLGFDETFIRTWEYYFDYCAAGYKTRTIGNYQIVFSRPENVAAFGDDPFHSSS